LVAQPAWELLLQAALSVAGTRLLHWYMFTNTWS
jgi:hypothetical protein